MGHNYVGEVSTRERYVLPPHGCEKRHSVVAYDCGIKTGILSGLCTNGCEVTVVPWDTPAQEVLDMDPDGIFLSNGPGDPDGGRRGTTRR